MAAFTIACTLIATIALSEFAGKTKSASSAKAMSGGEESDGHGRSQIDREVLDGRLG